MQVPLPQGSCFEPLTRRRPKGREGDRDVRIADAEELIRCLEVGRREVCGVEVRSILVEVKFKREKSC